MSRTLSDWDYVRLQQVGDAARALSATLARHSYTLATLQPPAWLRHVVGDMLVDLRSTLPESVYWRHLEAAGFDFAAGPAVTERVGTFVELDALLSLAASAATLPEPAAPPMGFHAAESAPASPAERSGLGRKPAGRRR
jgi:hypothetical protein